MKEAIMALEVTRTGKTGGNITSLCGNGWQHPKATAMANIQSGSQSYYVEKVLPRVYVRVVNGHLKTEADATSANNLDNLPDC